MYLDFKKFYVLAVTSLVQAQNSDLPSDKQLMISFAQSFFENDC